MKIKFQTKGEDLLRAMSIVQTVAPRANGSGESGYLFLVRGSTCYVYSRSEFLVTRAQFPIENVESEDASGDAAFAFPTEYVKGFEFFRQGVVTFEASSEGNTFRVNAVGDRKGASALRTSFDPRQLRTCDQEYESIRKKTDGYEFPTTVLSHALSLSKDFQPTNSDKTDDPKFTVEIMNEKDHAGGDGYMFALNGTQTLHYYTDAFKGKAMSVHVSHIDLILKFLSKSSGRIRLYEGESRAFMVNAEGNIIGWNRVGKKHSSFGYYDGLESFVLSVNPSTAIEALNYLKTQMDKSDHRIRMIYRHDGPSVSDGVLQFQVAEDGSNGNGITSWEIPGVVRNANMSDEHNKFDIYVTFESVMMILRGISTSNQISLRVHEYVNQARRNCAMIRTVDNGISLKDGDQEWQATVTRYTPQYG